MSNQRRSPRRASKKRSGRPRNHDNGVIGKLLIVLAVVAAIVLGVAIFFQVHHVEVQGNQIYSAEQIVEVSGLETGDNLLMVNKAAVTGKIGYSGTFVLIAHVVDIHGVSVLHHCGKDLHRILCIAPPESLIKQHTVGVVINNVDHF